MWWLCACSEDYTENGSSSTRAVLQKFSGFFYCSTKERVYEFLKQLVIWETNSENVHLYMEFLGQGRWFDF